MRSEKHSRRSLLAYTLGLCLAGCGPLVAAQQQQNGGDPAGGAAEGQGRGKSSDMNDEQPAPVGGVPEGKEVATLGAGCFWCVEAIFLEMRGVSQVVSGYSGGSVVDPTYEQVCSGTTGHAEAVRIVFDPKLLSYRDLLRVFFTTHDPTTLNRQGADVGTQYRSAIFYHSAEQKKAAEEVVREITKEKVYDDPIVTEVTAYRNFYAAEPYHQNYFARNPEQAYCRFNIAPKVLKFRQKYRHLLKK